MLDKIFICLGLALMLRGYGCMLASRSHDSVAASAASAVRGAPGPGGQC